MSEQDFLMSELLKCKKLLLAFNKEYEPIQGDAAETSMNCLLLIVNNLPENQRLTEEKQNEN